MSHDLETRNGTTSFAFNQKYGDPWHKLGTAVDGNMTITQALEVARADFTVTKQPLTATVPGVGGQDLRVPVVGKVGTVRNVPGTDEFQVLGVVGDGYGVVQNEEALQAAYDIVGASAGDAYLDTLGVLGEGQRLFSYLRLEDLVIDPVGINDKIERGLVIYWSHDGSIAMTYAFADVRAVCKNTVQMALEGATRVFKAKHTSAVQDRMKDAQRVLGVSTKWAEEFKRQAEDMLRVQYTEDLFEKYLNRVFPKASAKTERQQRNIEGIHAQVRGIFANERNSKEFGANGWTMYNSVVEYLDHGREADEASRLNATMTPGSWVEKRKLYAAKAVLTLA
jgi:phage/plasmid-like protein (TIGR03299 family)